MLTLSHRWCNLSPLLPLSSLSAMATYPPTCSNTNTSQGMNMANSIANLRLKAKEYSLNQVPTVNWNIEMRGAPRGWEGALSSIGEGHHLWDEHHSTYPGSWSLFPFLEQPWRRATTNVPMCKVLDTEWWQDFPQADVSFPPQHHWILSPQTDIQAGCCSQISAQCVCDCSLSGELVPVPAFYGDSKGQHGIVFSVVLDKITQRNWDQLFSFFLCLQQNDNNFLWHLFNYFFSHFFPFYTTDKQKLSTHF